LWTLTTNGHRATAHVKAIDGVDLQLRFSIDGELYYSHRFTAWEALTWGDVDLTRGELRISGDANKTGRRPATADLAA
jgi:hypothetical protein